MIFFRSGIDLSHLTLLHSSPTHVVDIVCVGHIFSKKPKYFQIRSGWNLVGLFFM